MGRWLKRTFGNLNYSQDILDYNKTLKAIELGFSIYNPKKIEADIAFSKTVFKAVFENTNKSLDQLNNMEYNLKHYGLNEIATEKMGEKVKTALTHIKHIVKKLKKIINKNQTGTIAFDDKFFTMLKYFAKHYDKELKIPPKL